MNYVLNFKATSIRFQPFKFKRKLKQIQIHLNRIIVLSNETICPQSSFGNQNKKQAHDIQYTFTWICCFYFHEIAKLVRRKVSVKSQLQALISHLVEVHRVFLYCKKTFITAGSQ